MDDDDVLMRLLAVTEVLGDIARMMHPRATARPDRKTRRPRRYVAIGDWV